MFVIFCFCPYTCFHFHLYKTEPGSTVQGSTFPTAYCMSFYNPRQRPWSNSYLPRLPPPLCPDVKLSGHYYTFICPQQLTDYSIRFIFPQKWVLHNHLFIPIAAVQVIPWSTNCCSSFETGHPRPLPSISLFALFSIYYFQKFCVVALFLPQWLLSTRSVKTVFLN